MVAILRLLLLGVSAAVLGSLIGGALFALAGVVETGNEFNLTGWQITLPWTLTGAIAVVPPLKAIAIGRPSLGRWPAAVLLAATAAGIAMLLFPILLTTMEWKGALLGAPFSFFTTLAWLVLDAALPSPPPFPARGREQKAR